MDALASRLRLADVGEYPRANKGKGPKGKGQLPSLSFAIG